MAEIVATLRPLVQSEETRSNNFNVRAAAILSACSIVTAISGFFAKDLYTENFKTFSNATEWATIIGLIGVLCALGATVIFCLSVLLPKTRYGYSRAHIRRWAGSPPQVTSTGEEIPPAGELPASKDAVLERTIHELGSIYDKFRKKNNTNANRLERAYIAFGVAVFIVLAVAVGLGIGAGVTEPTP